MFRRTYSRRGFIGLTGAGIAGIAGGSWLQVAAAAEAIAPVVRTVTGGNTVYEA